MAEPGSVSAPEGVTVDAVDWLPSGARSGIVRARGHRLAGHDPGLPLLVVVRGGAVRRFESLPDVQPAGELDAWRGAYVVEADVVAEAESVRLEWPGGGQLPVGRLTGGPPAPAGPDADVGPPAAEGTVVDRAVLAERRAGRAEAAEQVQARAARDALRAAEALELQSARLEEELGAARAERDALREGLSPEGGAAAREASAAAQIADLRAELARRPGLEEELARIEPGEAERRALRLRDALQAAVTTVGELRVQLHEAQLHRRTREVGYAADAVALAVATRDRRRLEEALAAARAELAEVRAARDAAAVALEEQRAATAGAVAAHEETRRRFTGAVGELREARERIAALEASLAGARDEAHRAAAGAADAAAARAELEGSRADLERAETAREAAVAAALASAARRRAAEVEHAAADPGRTRALEAQLAALRIELAAARRPAAAAEVAEPVAGEAAALDVEAAAPEEVEAPLDVEEAAPHAEEAAPLEAEGQQAAEGREAVTDPPLAALPEPALPEPEPPASDTPEPSPPPTPPAVVTAAAEQVRAAAGRAPLEAAPAERVVADLDGAANALRARATIVSAPSDPPGDVARGRGGREYPPLRGALVKLAHDDPRAATRLLADLLPALHLVVDEPTEVDLTLETLGTLAVSAGAESTTVRTLPGPRARRATRTHLRTDAVGLAERLAGVGGRVRRRRGPLRATHGRRRARALLAAAATDRSLAELVAAGARPEPRRTLRAFAYAVPPGWAAGQRWTVDVDVDGAVTRLEAAEGSGLRTVNAEPDGTATARWRLARSDFDALLAGEPAEPVVEGDPSTVDVLLAWADRLRGPHEAESRS